MKVALLSSEVTPFAKTGGLADVTGSLPKFLAKLGLEIIVIMPLYREVRKKELPLIKVEENCSLDWDKKKEYFTIWKYPSSSFPVYFIQKENYYDRDNLYSTAKGDYPDNGERFAFFSMASLETLKALNFSPQILHCHDWQTAISLAYLKFLYHGDPFFNQIHSLFTIHNLAYQGLFDKEILGKIGLPKELFNMEDLEFYGKVNFLKAGILYANAVNTVSPRYSQEIQTPEQGHGLDGLLRKRSPVLYGILNGVDYSSWNPQTDELILSNYTAQNFKGKEACKIDLLQAFELPIAKKNIPVIGMVSRLAGQKGFDILCQALDEIFKMDVYLVILGTGEEKFQNILKAAKEKFPSCLGLKIAFDEQLAHKVTAGSDLFLIPSRYEPCGLTQMYSLKYGTIPVVRATGGLDDVIQEFDSERDSGNGFKFQDYSPAGLLSSLGKAVAFFKRKDKWNILLKNAMAYDFSWEKSALKYLKLYEKIISI